MAFSPNITGPGIRQNATSIADEVERFMARWEYWCYKMSTITSEELTELGITDENYKNYLGSLRTQVQGLVDYHSANSNFIQLFTDLTVI